MTLKNNARLAGFAFLLYIVIGITDMALSAARGEGTAARLASIAQNAPVVRLSALLALLMALCALVIAATIYALTRDYDRDLARLAMLCRVVEGANNAAAALTVLRLLSVATAATAAAGAELAATNALGTMLLSESFLAGATMFAVGSTIYCWIFLRARTIPLWLAWLGLVASVVLIVCLPLQILGLMKGGWLEWIPMLVFEVVFALWLLIKGVAAQPRRTNHSSIDSERPVLV